MAGTVPAGGCSVVSGGSLLAPPAWASSQGTDGDWDIYNSDKSLLVATNAIPVGWSVSTGPSNTYTVCAPATAATGNYQVWYETEILPVTGYLTSFVVSGAPQAAAAQGSGTLEDYLFIKAVKMPECRVNFSPILIAQQVDGYTVPFGYQIINSEAPDYIQINPGVAEVNGTPGNSQLGIRIYSGTFAAKGWNQGHPDTPLPVHTQVFAYPTMLPWGKSLDLYIEFVSPGNAAMPANSYVEMTIRPFS